MENTDPLKMYEEEISKSPNHDHDKSIFLDTHAMAYKLLLTNGCHEYEKKDSVTKCISEYGKEARMDFYKNRSRSDGASTILKSNLNEIRQLIDEENQVDSMNRSRSFDNGSRKRLLSVPNKATLNHKDDEPLANDQPKIPKQEPLLYIPAVDSSDDLLNFARNAASMDTRKKVFAQNRFVPYFSLPLPSFILHCLLDERKICLESFISNANIFTSTVLVKRFPLSTCNGRKRVYCRRTLDNWQTYQEMDGTFLESTVERSNVDRYSINMSFMQKIQSGARMEFALAYEINLGEKSVVYWDNNNNANYAFWYSG